MCLDSGQAVPSPSHPGGARPGEGWHDDPGSAGSASIKTHPPVSCLTRARMLCTTHSPPVDPPPPPGSRAPPGGRTQQGSASAWLNQETGGELPLSFYMMSAATLLPVHQISTCILFLVAGGQCVFLRCLDSPRRDRKDPMFWWRHVFTSQHAPCLLNLQGPVLRTFQCWCVRYLRWGDDRHVTHSFTKEIWPFVILFYIISLLYLLRNPDSIAFLRERQGVLLKKV